MQIIESKNMNVQIRCKRCHRLIGELVEVDGQEWLSVNSVLITVMRGSCTCGEEFHWSISEQQLARLIERVKKC